MPLVAAIRRLTLTAPILLGVCSLFTAVARADIRIEIEGVDGEPKRNVLALLSVERYKDRERLEPQAVQRLYNRIDGEVRSALRPFGYYEPKINASLQSIDKGKRWRVHLAIDPGPPVTFDQISVKVEGPGSEEPAFKTLVESPPIHSGERLSHPSYEQLKGALERAASTYGYLDARMLRSELLVDPTARKASVYLELQTGERYYFGATTIEQNVVGEPQIRRFLRYREGEPYDAIKLLRTQFALDDSQYFSTVELLVGERDPATHIVPISIRATSARRSYSFGGGYGTDTGVRGTASLTVPHINDRGHRFRVQTQLSQITQLLDSHYDVPIGDPALEKFSLGLLAQQSQISNSVSISEIAFGPSITQIKGGWQRLLSLDYLHTITTDPISSRRVDNLIVPSITYASVPEGYLGEALFSRGLYAQLLGSGPKLGARATFLRFDVQAEHAFNLSASWHVLLRGEVGASTIHDIDTIHDIEDLPGQYRYFAGGDRSVRGFGYNSLSPTVEAFTAQSPNIREAVQVGGRGLVTATFELERDLPRNFGVAMFFDIGNAINNFNDPLAESVGVGFRWRLPVVTVGMDIAQAIYAPGFSSLPGPRLHLNISPKL